MLRKWNELPEYMQTEAVRPYYEILRKKKLSLILKRLFDIVVSVIMIGILFPIMVIIAILIITDSKGGIFYRQERITRYGRKFRIYKFRTMVANADKIGTQVTVSDDSRITKIGKKLRKYRLDEIPQLLNILAGDMTFVGVRPESVHYVKHYTPEMMATLLLPAGLTSEASIRYRDEAKMLDNVSDVDKVYIEKILPEKMKDNLESIKKFDLFRELITMFKTVLTVFG